MLGPPLSDATGWDDVANNPTDLAARNALLDAETEVELAKTIEAGLFAKHLLAEGRVGRRKGGAPKRATQEELEWLVEEGGRRLRFKLSQNDTLPDLPLVQFTLPINTSSLAGYVAQTGMSLVLPDAYVAWVIVSAALWFVVRGLEGQRGVAARLPAA